MKSSTIDLTNRGWVSEEFYTRYLDLSNDDLYIFLKSTIPSKRTVAAQIIKIRKSTAFVNALITALSHEQKLYSKIAISEALGTLGEMATRSCIPYLGKIGNNQHKQLPAKPFMKNNYPLPRDIIARTICKTGQLAIPVMLEEIDIDNIQQLSEAIDAIGYISYYTKDHSAQKFILSLFQHHHDNDIIAWKILRSLMSFPNTQVVNFLKQIIETTNIPQLRWEAQRSLTSCLQQLL
jgi:hypothetical protein